MRRARRWMAALCLGLLLTAGCDLTKCLDVDPSRSAGIICLP